MPDPNTSDATSAAIRIGGEPGDEGPPSVRSRLEARQDQRTRAGLLYGFGAYGLWGLLPVYFFILSPATSVEIVANRVVWSLIFCAALITLTRTWRHLGATFRNRFLLGQLVVAAVLIGGNWLTLTFGVITGQAVESSLGFFIGPLISVLLGVFVLKEKVRPLQWAAVAVGVVAVVVLTLSYGKLPWIALTLAITFGLYSLVKNKVGPSTGAVVSLTVETVVLTPIAVAAMIYLAAHGNATLTNNGVGHFLLLAASGIVMTVPLLFFGASARRLTMVTIAMLQYLAPLLQFVVALVVFHETMTPQRWIGFSIVWLALLLLTTDMLVVARQHYTVAKAKALPEVR